MQSEQPLPMPDTLIPDRLIPDTLGLWLGQLYLGALNQPVATFKGWCFDSIKALLNFDSGLWGTRSDIQHLALAHWVEDSHLHQQPGEFMANYLQLATEHDGPDPLNQHLSDNPGRFFTVWDVCPPQLWYQSDFYLRHCRLYGVEQAISAITLPDEHCAVSHVFSFYRAERGCVFSTAEIALANLLLPNLVEAFRTNLLNSFSGQSKNPGSVRAIADRFGEIIEAEEGFYQQLKNKQLLQQNKLMLPRLDETITMQRLELAGMKLDIRFDQGLFYLEAFETSLVEKLSKREKEVCKLMIKGLSNKEIANYLKNNHDGKALKINTINAHIRNIFITLNVTSRAAATAYLIRAGGLNG